MPCISRWLAALKVFLGYAEESPCWSQRAAYTAANPWAPCSRQWVEEARLFMIDDYFNDLYMHQKNIAQERQRRLRRLMTQGRPLLPGSPRAWQWPVDEDSERECWILLLDDALNGSIYDSGAIQFQVEQGPCHLTGTELKDTYLRESYIHKDALIWRVEPSLSGYHSWSLHPVTTAPKSPLASLRAPSLSSSILTVSQYGELGSETPVSTTPRTPSQVEFPFEASAVAAADDRSHDMDTIRPHNIFPPERHGTRVMDPYAFTDYRITKLRRAPSTKEVIDKDDTARTRPKRPQLRPVQDVFVSQDFVPHGNRRSHMLELSSHQTGPVKRPASRSPSRSSIASMDLPRPSRSRVRARVTVDGSSRRQLSPLPDQPQTGGYLLEVSSVASPATSQIPRYSLLRHRSPTHPVRSRPDTRRYPSSPALDKPTQSPLGLSDGIQDQNHPPSGVPETTTSPYKHHQHGGPQSRGRGVNRTPYQAEHQAHLSQPAYQPARSPLEVRAYSPVRIIAAVGQLQWPFGSQRPPTTSSVSNLNGAAKDFFPYKNPPLLGDALPRMTNQLSRQQTARSNHRTSSKLRLEQ